MGLRIVRVVAEDIDTALSIAEDHIYNYRDKNYDDSGECECFAFGVLDPETDVLKTTSQFDHSDFYNDLDKVNTVERLNKYMNELFYNKDQEILDRVRNVLNENCRAENMNLYAVRNWLSDLIACSPFHDNRKVDVLNDIINEQEYGQTGICEPYQYGAELNGKTYLVLCDTAR